MCGIYCVYNLDLVSFLFVPALYSTLKDLLVSSLFVLSNVIHVVEDIVGLYTCTRQSSLLWYV